MAEATAQGAQDARVAQGRRKVRGITLTREMVCAQRRPKNPKTQTRRVIKEPAWFQREYARRVGKYELVKELDCPYGAAGDLLYVKESYATPDDDNILYRADVSNQDLKEEARVRRAHRDIASAYPGARWKSGRFMAKRHARTLLEIVEVRVQRVQDISEEDALAEGIVKLSKDGGRTWKYGLPDRDGWPGTDDVGQPWSEWKLSAREAFFGLWDSINGKRPGCALADNPYVWAITFKPVTGAWALP